MLPQHNAITEKYILGLLEQGAVEDAYIEYKRDLPGKDKDQLWAFLKGVTAFANAGNRDSDYFPA